MQYDSASAGVPTIQDCSFVGNVASSAGGAIHLDGISANITGSEFLNNSAGSGGAVFGSGCTSEGGTATSSPLSFSGTTFSNNTAQGGIGGAVAATSCSIVFSQTALRGNTATAGGAVYAGVSLADVHLMRSGGAAFSAAFNDGCVVRENSVLVAAGSGVCAAAGVALSIEGGAWAPANAAANASSSDCNMHL